MELLGDRQGRQNNFDGYPLRCVVDWESQEQLFDVMTSERMQSIFIAVAVFYLVRQLRPTLSGENQVMERKTWTMGRVCCDRTSDVALSHQKTKEPVR